MSAADELRDADTAPIEPSGSGPQGTPKPGEAKTPDAAPGEAMSVEEARDPIEELAAEFTERLRRGEAPAISEYAQKHPSLADEILELFPTISAVERLKATRRLGSDGRATLGGDRLERLGDYRILREVGRGGMGIVYEAEQESLGRRVAVKVLPRQSLLDPKHLRRFEREARMAAGLHHTNIVPVFGVGEQDGYHYFVMQFIDGVGLDRVVERLARTTQRKEGEGGEAGPQPCWLPPPGRPRWQSVASIGVQAAEALDYAHSRGVLHRDVKPGNLLIDSAGVVWVTDFGLAKALGHDEVSQTGDIVGTLRYIAPEQLEGRHDARSDVYSLGLTLYELLALRPAFDDPDRSSLLKKIAQGSPPPPSKIRPEIPRDLETIVLKAISREPGHRYPSAAELALDLRRFLEDRPIHARRTHPVVRLWRWARRERAVASLAGTAALLVALVAVVATVGYIRTRAAMEGERRQSAKADAISGLAMDALERIFDRFAPRRPAPTSDVTVQGSEGEEIEVPVQPVLSREAAALLDQLLEFYGRLAAEGADDRRLREKSADAQRRVGDIRQRLGDVDEARAAYGKALEAYQGLCASAKDEIRFPIEIARIHNELGRTAWASGEPGQASHRTALEVLESVQTAAGRSPSFRYEMARTHYFLGRRPPPDSDPAAAPAPPGSPGSPGPPGRPGPPDRAFGPAEGSFGPPDRSLAGPERSFGGADRSLAPPREPRDRRRTGGRGEGPKEKDREWGNSGEEMHKAIRILEELVAEHPGIPDYRQLLALCYRELRPFDWKAAALGESAPGEKATEILRKLVADFPDVPDYRYDLAETLAAAAFPGGPFFFGPRGPGPRTDAERKQAEARARLAESTGALQGLHAVSEMLAAAVLPVGPLFFNPWRMSSGAGVERKQPEPGARLAESIEILEGLVAKHPNVPDYASALVQKLLRSSGAEEWAGRKEEAARQIEKAAALQAGLAERFPEVTSYRWWLSFVRGAQAHLDIELGKRSEALAALESSAATLEALLKEQPHLGQVRFLLMMNYDQRADVLRKDGEDEKAREVLEKKKALGELPRGAWDPRGGWGSRGGGWSPRGDGWGPRGGGSRGGGPRDGPFSPGGRGGRERDRGGGP